jgi:hypothetical protein
MRRKYRWGVRCKNLVAAFWRHTVCVCVCGVWCVVCVCVRAHADVASVFVHGRRGTFQSIGTLLLALIEVGPFSLFRALLLTSSHVRTQTRDGTIYFRAATRVSPRNYKSFTARKFLQVTAVCFPPPRCVALSSPFPLFSLLKRPHSLPQFCARSRTRLCRPDPHPDTHTTRLCVCAPCSARRIVG